MTERKKIRGKKKEKENKDRRVSELK